jgi:ABC-type multidrug transport system fused ATPase/permease subunit
MERSRDVLRRGARLLARYIRGQPRTFAISVTGATIFALSAVGTTVVLGWVTDHLIIPAFDEGAPRSALVGSVVALLCVTFLRATSIVLRRYFGAMTGRRTQAGLRRGIADRYLHVPLRYHQATPTGQLLAHADADVEAATEILYPLPFSVGVIMLILFSVISLLAVDPWLALVAVVLFPLLSIVNRIYISRVEEPARLAQDQVGRVASVAHESIDGAMVVKALGHEQAEVERLAVEADALRLARIRVGRMRGTFEPAIDAFPNLGIVALLALGAYEVSTGLISTGELVQAMALFGILAFPMRVVGFFFEELPRSLVSIERIDRVLAEPDAPRPEFGTALVDGAYEVTFDDVTFAYEAGTPVLQGLSFRLDPGEVVALVGSTGSGKSTLCQLLAHLIEPDRGRVTVAGVDVQSADAATLRRTVALAFQEAFLFADSLRENITLGTVAGDRELEAAAHIAQADRFIERLPARYDTVVGERGVTLSGGQRQRVALARALVRRPHLLVLDDATSAVDPTIESAILAGLRRALDTTTLIVAHRVSTIALADRVLFLEAGRVVAAGPHEELLRTVPAYEAIVRAYEAAAELPDDDIDEVGVSP